MRGLRKYFIVIALLSLLLTTIGSSVAQAHPVTTFQQGDVFVAVSDGKVKWFEPDGTYHMTLNTGLTGYTTGMAFDDDDNLYVTCFNAQTVTKFDNTGGLVGPFGSGYTNYPESIVFNDSGHAYVGQAYGDILEFDDAGNPVAQFDVYRSDCIDLAGDQRTVLYTSDSSSSTRKRIMAYDVVSDTPLPDFASSLPGYKAFALRILPDGSVLVANYEAIYQVASGGAVLNSWRVTGDTTGMFALNLDPDGVHFWSASYVTSKIYKFRLDTPGTNTQVLSFSSGTPYFTVFGLSICGELTQGNPSGHGYCEGVVVSCDSAGNEKNAFSPGETVYVKGSDFPAGDYKIWIQHDPVEDGDALVAADDPSGTQEPVTVAGDGDIPITAIWVIPSDATATFENWDIVVDKQDDGSNTDKYNYSSDGIDDASIEGFVAPIPELPTIILFGMGLLGIGGYWGFRRSRNKRQVLTK